MFSHRLVDDAIVLFRLVCFFKQITSNSFAQFVAHFLRFCGRKAASWNTLTAVLKLKGSNRLLKGGWLCARSFLRDDAAEFNTFLEISSACGIKGKHIANFVIACKLRCRFSLFQMAYNAIGMTHSNFTPGDGWLGGLIRRGHSLIRKLFLSVDFFKYSAHTRSKLQPILLQNTKLMTAFQIAKSVPAPNPIGRKYRGNN